MIRTKTSLKDRGLELLGMSRRQPGQEPLASPLQREKPSPGKRATAEETTSTIYSSTRVRYHVAERDVRYPLEVTEIERLLSEEADMAVGGEEEAVVTSPPSVPPEEISGLPTEEWIAPIPVKAMRPLPTPPPELPKEQGPPMSAPVDASVPQRECEFDRLITPVISKPDDVSREVLSAPDSSTKVAEQLAALERAIETEYERIRREQVSISQGITDWCHQLLMEARTIVTQRRIEELPRAEWCVEQVRARLDRAQRSATQMHTPFALTLWGMGWFFVLVYLVFDPTWVLRWIGLSEAVDFFINPGVFLRALVFGGLGGVAAVFYHVIKHVRERSFDSKHTLSYLGKPFMGMILGAMAYLGMFVFMRVLGMKPVGLQVSDTEMLTHVLYMAALYLLAIMLGFKENRVFNLLNRAVKAILGGEIRRSQAEEI